MATILYTTTEAVRACLGVTEREFEDAQILDLKLAVQLELELEDVYEGHADIKAAVDAESATAEQLRIWALLQMYSQYQAAVFMLPGIQNLLAQRVSDGDAEMQRFMKDDLQSTIDRIVAMRDKYRNKLNPALFAGSLFNPIGIVIPSRDPVVE